MALAAITCLGVRSFRTCQKGLSQLAALLRVGVDGTFIWPQPSGLRQRTLTTLFPALRAPTPGAGEVRQLCTVATVREIGPSGRPLTPIDTGAILADDLPRRGSFATAKR